MTNRHLTESLDVKQVLERIGRGAKQIIDAFGCTIYLLEEDGVTLTPVVSLEPPNDDEILSTPLIVETSFTGQAAKAKRSLIFNEAGVDEAGIKILNNPAYKEERVIVVPLIADEEVLGAMHLNRMGKLFTEEDLTLAETFATYAATALKNARAHDELQREMEELVRAELALRKSEAQYRITIDSMEEAIHVVDTDLKLVMINSSLIQWMKRFDLETNAIGKTIFDVFPFLHEKVREEYQHVINTGEYLITEKAPLSVTKRSQPKPKRYPSLRENVLLE